MVIKSIDTFVTTSAMFAELAHLGKTMESVAFYNKQALVQKEREGRGWNIRGWQNVTLHSIQ